MHNKKWALGLVIGSLLLAGCGANSIDQTSTQDPSEQVAVEQNQGQEDAAAAEEKGDPQDPTAGTEEPPSSGDQGLPEGSSEEKEVQSTDEPAESGQLDIDLQAIQPNELGEVMVIMYHGLTKKNTTYSRTPESFQADLEELYADGFRPVSFESYLSGNFDVAPGMTPFVLTFDDGNKSNFNVWEENGEIVIDPKSAVGIMEAFSADHPDFDPQASFFLNGGTPFGQADYLDWKLQFLHDNGYGIGNHSWGHDKLLDLDVDQIQKSLGRNVNALEDRVAGLTVDTLALPFGERPKDEARYNAVTSGTYDGRTYTHKGILLVGWKPDVSPFDTRYDPLSIMRAQSGDGKDQLRRWLDDYKERPYKKFISDGDPNVVTIPESKLEKLDMDQVGDRQVITYVPEK